MDLLSEILKLLGINKLEEADQKVVEDKIKILLETKVNEVVVEKLEEEKEKLEGEYDDKFDEYKDYITETFSNFVDSILDPKLEELDEDIKEYARKGQLYGDVIEQLKVRLAIEEGALNDEVNDLLTEAHSEIQALRKNNDALKVKNLELQKDAKDLSTYVYINKKVTGLTEDQRIKAVALLEGLDTSEKIDAKFELIKETFNIKTDDKEKDKKIVGKGSAEILTEEDKDKSKDKDTPFGKTMEHWLSQF